MIVYLTRFLNIIDRFKFIKSISFIQSIVAEHIVFEFYEWCSNFTNEVFGLAKIQIGEVRTRGCTVILNMLCFEYSRPSLEYEHG